MSKKVDDESSIFELRQRIQESSLCDSDRRLLVSMVDKFLWIFHGVTNGKAKVRQIVENLDFCREHQAVLRRKVEKVDVSQLIEKEEEILFSVAEVDSEESQHDSLKPSIVREIEISQKAKSGDACVEKGCHGHLKEVSPAIVIRVSDIPGSESLTLRKLRCSQCQTCTFVSGS